MWLQADGEGRSPGAAVDAPDNVPDHAGLGYTRCAPLAVLRKESKERKPWEELRHQWLTALTRCPVPAHYPRTLHRWRRSFQGPETFVTLGPSPPSGSPS